MNEIIHGLWQLHTISQRETTLNSLGRQDKINIFRSFTSLTVVYAHHTQWAWSKSRPTIIIIIIIIIIITIILSVVEVAQLEIISPAAKHQRVDTKVISAGWVITIYPINLKHVLPVPSKSAGVASG